MVEREQQFDRGARELLPPPSERPLSEKCVFLNGDGGCWWLLLAKNRALVAAACRDPTSYPQLLLIVVFFHRSIRRHEWLYPLKLNIVPGLQAEQHSGNLCHVQQRAKVNPPNRRTSMKEEGGGTSSRQGTKDIMLATALLLLTAGGMATVNICGIVAAVAIGGSGGGFGVVNAHALA